MNSSVKGIVARYKLSKSVTLDLAWIEKVRKDFLVLTKNLTRVKDYDTALELRGIIRSYLANFENILYNNFLKRDLEELYPTQAEFWSRELKKVSWSFFAALRDYPLSFSKDISPEQHYIRFTEQVPKWKTRVQAEARKLWATLEKFTEEYTRNQGSAPVTEVREEKVQLEGFRTVLLGFDSNNPWHHKYLSVFREGLKDYKRKAAVRLPVLLKHQVPLKLQFDAEIDKGGTYDSITRTINFFMTSSADTPERTTQVLAHEMGHHLYKSYLDSKAVDFWETAIKGDLGDLDLRELLNKWPGKAWAYDFLEAMADKDPVLALQVDSISYDLSYSGDAAKLQSKEDFQELYDSGVKTLRVPQHPITGYANRNPEEAFCEAIGLLISAGPGAIPDLVRKWLAIVLPGDIRLARQNNV